MDDPVIQRIAAAHGASAAQVTLAWLLQQDFAVIPSSTKRAHQESNLAARNLRLSTQDMDDIAALERNQRLANPDFAPLWD
jgi:2,5-diketo-D-gluconate reductase B